MHIAASCAQCNDDDDDDDDNDDNDDDDDITCLRKHFSGRLMPIPTFQSSQQHFSHRHRCYPKLSPLLQASTTTALKAL